jgi:hypothetical protein
MLKIRRLVFVPLLLLTTYLNPQQAEATSCSVGLFQLPGSSIDCMVTHGEYTANVGGHDHPPASSALTINTGTILANGGLTGNGFVDFTFASGLHAAGLFLTVDLFPKGSDNHFLGLVLYQDNRFLGGGTYTGLPDGPPANPLDPTARGMGIVTDGSWSFNRVQVTGLSSPDILSVLHIEFGTAIPVPPLASVPEPSSSLLLGVGLAGILFLQRQVRKGSA